MKVDHPGNGSIRLSDGRAILMLIPAPVEASRLNRIGLSLVAEGGSYIDIPRNEAVTLGRWLLETFGESL